MRKVYLLIFLSIFLISCSNNDHLFHGDKTLGEDCVRYECIEGLECYPYDGGKCIEECPLGYQRYNESLCLKGV